MQASTVLVLWALAAAPASQPMLSRELSPYLLSHASDPIGWQAWGSAAFDRARREEKPVLLWVGRGSCPGCRAREQAILADAQVAELLSRRFVCVLVDRDERPDVADVYASALSLLSDTAAPADLPLLALLTADGRPFFGGPSRDDEAYRTGLGVLLAQLGEGYAGERPRLEASAGATVARLREAQAGDAPKGPLASDVTDRALRGLRDAWGSAHVAPTAPPHAALRFLLAEHARSGSGEALRLETRILDALSQGGLRAREGGFHHETADEAGRVPRPEKRLDDNALLLRAYAEAHAATGNAAYRETAEAVAAWALRELKAPAGGFRAAVTLDGESKWVADDRVFAGANGLMIGALATSGSILGRPKDVNAAREAAAYVLEALGPPTGLHRYALGADRGGAALLDDHAYLAEGLLDLYDATRDARWRAAAVAVVDAALGRFLDVAAGGFFSTPGDVALLPARLKDGFDGALPAPNGVLASVLLRLAQATGEKRYADLGRQTVLAFLGELQRAPRGVESLAAVAGELLGKPAAATAVEEPAPARVVRGPVTLEATLSSASARPGQLLEARVRLTIARPFCVPAHKPLDKGLVGLGVSLPGDEVSPSPPRYPDGTAVHGGITREIASVYYDEADVVVPFRLPREAAAGERRVRVLVRYQPCDERDCRKPESVVLEVPVTVGH